jgi:uncharacterized damage-inducible protein DinB
MTAPITASIPRGAHVEHTDLRAISFHHVRFLGLEMVDVEITGEIEDVTINGVDIGPLIDAELNRRMPDRAKMHPTTVEEFQEAWAILERLWADTEDRARTLPPDLLHERVRGEWSLVETLRHLNFASAAWVGRMVLGDPVPWHPLDLPWDEMPDTPGTPRARAVRPTLDEVLALRRDRMATVRTLVDDLTEESLARHTEPVDAPGWPPAESFPVRECLLVVLNEEYHHRLFAERDLDALQARGGSV